MATPHYVFVLCPTAFHNQTICLTPYFNIFFDVLKNSLSNEQYDALKDVIQKSDNINVAKTKIMDKLKSFGESVMSNIIASLITNPSIWNNLHI